MSTDNDDEMCLPVPGRVRDMSLGQIASKEHALARRLPKVLIS